MYACARRPGSAAVWPSLLAIAVLAGGCATSSGIHHVVRPGENLYRIGKAYGVSYQDLAKLNDIAAPYRLEIGDRLYVPEADRQLPVTLITPRAVSAAPPPPEDKPVPVPSLATRVPVPAGARGPIATSASGFAWPTSGRLASGFGKRARGHHDGIDISAPKGSAVIAAREGKVIFSDRLSGYGNVLIVEHSGGFTTVYAHNQQNLVTKGAQVRRGDTIATVGDTGRTHGSHLHFEVRKQNVARNPLYYLPAAPAATAAVR